MGASAHDHRDSVSHMLFVTLPTRETFTARRLPETIGLASLKTRLELLVGVPSFVWSLQYGDTLLTDDDTLVFGRNIRNCAILRVVWQPDWGALCEAAIGNDVTGVEEQLVHVRPLKELDPEKEEEGPPVGEEQVDNSWTHSADHTADRDSIVLCRRFVALYVAAHRGRLEVIRYLIKQGADFLKLQTDFGRTVVHAAAASDQARVLDMLALHSSNMSCVDSQGKSPLDTAISHGAYTSERAIRNYMLRYRNKKASSKASASKSKSSSPSSPNTSSNVLRDYMRSRTAQPRSQTTVSASYRGLSFGRSSQDPGRGVVVGSNGRVYKSDISSTSALRVQSENSGSVTSVSPRPAPRQTRDSSRCGSATTDFSSSHGIHGNAHKHKHCHQSPPFLAYRSVPPDELKPIAVEYVPLETNNYRGRIPKKRNNPTKLGYKGAISCPDAPYSSLNNSLEDIPASEELGGRRSIEKTVTWVDERDHDESGQDVTSRREFIKNAYTLPQGSTTRAQSAKYYRTKYHLLAEEDTSIPKPRPATAGPRYREWKLWLLEKYENNENEQDELDEDEHERQQASLQAFEKWLRRKRREEAEASESSSESEDDSQAPRPRKVVTSPDSPAYRKWLDKKKDVFAEMDKRGRDKVNPENSDPRKRVTIYEIGDTTPGEMKVEGSDRYMRSYQTWVKRKKQYEQWKKKKGLPRDDMMSVTNTSLLDLHNIRKAMALDAVTYEEWLGQKQREHSFNRSSVRS